MFEFLRSKNRAGAPDVSPETPEQESAIALGSKNLVLPVKPAHPMEVYLKTNRVSYPKVGEMVEGKFIGREGSRAYFDLARMGLGIIYGQEFFDAQDTLKHLKEGEVIAAKVVEFDNAEGYVELSLREAGIEKAWQELRRLMQSGETFSLKVLDANRGGLILEKESISGFLPVSQLSQQHYPRVEGGDKEKIFMELKKFIGQTL